MKTNDKLYIIQVNENNQIIDYNISEIKSFKRDKDMLYIHLYPIIGDSKVICFGKRFNFSCLKSVYRSFDYVAAYKTYFTISKKAFLNLLNTFNIETLPEEWSNLVPCVTQFVTVYYLATKIASGDT